MPPESLSAQLEMIVPLAVEWASEQQERVLQHGVPLTIREFADALRVGVKDPERVRLLQVDAIPSPTHPGLRAAYQRGHFAPTSPRGLALHYGVFVRADQWRDRGLIVHELVHTAQYERLGGIEAFLKKYLLECATVGYNKSALEREALTMASRVLENAELVSA